MAAVRLYCIALFGITLRIALMQTGLSEWLKTRNEISTPVNSWERVEEGFALQSQFISPYSGDVFHETPLALRGFKLAQHFPFGVKGFFMIIDILTMVILYKISSVFGQYLLSEQDKEKKSYSPKSKTIQLTQEDVNMLPTIVLAVYVLNPFSIMTTLALSTTAISNLMVLLAFYYLIQGEKLQCLFFLAFSTYQSLYPLVFIVPASLHFYTLSQPKSSDYTGKAAVVSYFKTSSVFSVFFALLIAISYLLEGSWQFLLSTYGFILTVPDLTPNSGVFWYFFTEMFEHFRTFFVCVFQLNAFVYTVPLAVRFPHKPYFLMYILLFLTSIFKSYPSYADAALYFSLLPLWRHVFSYLRNSLVVGGMYICCIVLSPILYHLWIFAGSANANFYFAITLTYSTAQIFLVSDLLYAYLRREYDLYHGTEHKNADGTKAVIILE